MSLPSFSKMYLALCEKDSQFEGVFIACVKSTGIFCRPTCRARKPKKENVEFVSSTQEALRKGYRPCKVCLPMKPMGSAPDWIEGILNKACADEGIRLSDQDLRAEGIDPNRLRRWFKKHHNMTFQAYLRSLRMGKAFGYLTSGGKVMDTAFESGYESVSGFQHSFKKLTGRSPSKLKSGDIINVYQISTPLGPMIAASIKNGICLLEFTDRRGLETEFIDLQKRLQAPIVTSETKLIQKLKKQLHEYFQGERKSFDIELVTPGSDFQNQVWSELRQIPYGQVRSYKQQAQALGNPKAIRAVARANGMNRIAIIIPCHRVIGSDGSLVGYAGGLERKKKLLEIEGYF